MKTILFYLSLFFAVSVSAQNVQTFTLKKLPTKPVNELLTRGMISGEQGTIGYFTYKKGAVVPTHQHSNEQYSLITKGSVKVKILDKEYIVKAGDGIIIPLNVPHSFTALEDDTIDIDFFSPARKDWIEGKDNYYEKK
ncbi:MULTISPECIES: cupin domain-containing protein [unclassified Chryseobacterium]|uniref:cupin domain-containing protein n=1 Tax=unclassified Chryseobacterium TaxID=2593645 RepID=UPI000DB62689|nr:MULTISPECIES: cupin domain-containing protein [unclassified Chryseobacterium]PZU80659.1 MAG: cupin domain-containing protein [Chryseobacterium sp.]UMQ41681.1 cupin domain-containing protein [Chryseobacterium sp. Y16C]